MSPPGRPRCEFRSAQHEATPVKLLGGPTALKTKQTGAATLLVVMVIFFVVALVAAYANRNLIFEQRTSANHYRATQAYELAEAGTEWTLAMLNSGRITAQCLPSTDETDATFKERYFDVADDGSLTKRPNVPNPGCSRNTDGSLQCSCATTAAADATPAKGAGTLPGFSVSLSLAGAPGAVTLSSNGCTVWDTTCASGQGTATGDSASRITMVAGLAHSLATPPNAALTVRGNLAIGAATLRLINADAGSGGITLNTGGSVDATGLQLVSAAGSDAADSMVANDAHLQALSADQMFFATFGMARSTAKIQPVAQVFTDCGNGCVDKLVQAAKLRPWGVLWVEGDLNLDQPVDLGNPTQPVLLVVTGHITTTLSTRIYGVVYCAQANWQTSGAGATVVGAVMAEGQVSGDGAPTFQFDPDVVKRVAQRMGSMVRVPGGWMDN